MCYVLVFHNQVKIHRSKMALMVMVSDVNGNVDDAGDMSGGSRGTCHRYEGL